MTEGPTDKEQKAALEWRNRHAAHVARLCNERDGGALYPPSGSDCRHPELWRAPHWRWLAAEDKAGDAAWFASKEAEEAADVAAYPGNGMDVVALWKVAAEKAKIASQAWETYFTLVGNSSKSFDD